MKAILLFSGLLLLLSGCGDASTMPLSFADKIENAHAKDKFMAEEAVRFDLHLSFGGKERLNGTLSLLTNSTKGRIDYVDGRTLIFDGGKVYYSPEFTEAQASFAAYTWSYFFMLPYKTTDPGTRLVPTHERKLRGRPYNSKKLVFDPHTGASPDDWYILYAHTTSHLLHAAAYIVTANKSAEKAEEDPHAIEYLAYEEVEGIPVATQWKFWGWRTGIGFTEQLGEARLSNFSFVAAKALDFQPAENMITAGTF